MLQTITIEESNGNLAIGTNNSLTSSVSNEDLSLSEYTDADESMSAPTEFLAEVSFVFKFRNFLINNLLSSVSFSCYVKGL